MSAPVAGRRNSRRPEPSTTACAARRCCGRAGVRLARRGCRAKTSTDGRGCPDGVRVSDALSPAANGARVARRPASSWRRRRARRWARLRRRRAVTCRPSAIGQAPRGVPSRPTKGLSASSRSMTRSASNGPPVTVLSTPPCVNHAGRVIEEPNGREDARCPAPSAGASMPSARREIVQGGAEAGLDRAQAFEHDPQRLGRHGGGGEAAEPVDVRARPQLDGGRARAGELGAQRARLRSDRERVAGGVARAGVQCSDGRRCRTKPRPTRRSGRRRMR